MNGLTEGRIVHYVMPSHEHRPAIVVRVWSYGAEGVVNLVVFVDGLNDVKKNESSDPIPTTLWETSVVYDNDNKLPNTWHWIEKA